MPLSAPSLAALLLTSTLGMTAAATTIDHDISQLENLAQGFGTAPPAIGRNVDGGSVFANFFRAYRDGAVLCAQLGPEQVRNAGCETGRTGPAHVVRRFDLHQS